MKKHYLYLVTDGNHDYYKFGITDNLDIRLSQYNTSQHIRPNTFIRTYEFDSEEEARRVENILKKELSPWITMSTKTETFKVSDKTLSIFESVVGGLKDADYVNTFIGNKNNEKFDYIGNIKKKIDECRERGVYEKLILSTIIRSKCGYRKEDTPNRVLFEKRRILIDVLDGVEVYSDTKPSTSTKYARIARLNEINMFL